MFAVHSYRFSERTFTPVLTVILILLTGAAVQAQRPSRLVEAVDVIGNRRLSKDAILSHVKTRPGERYRAKQVQRDLQTILSLGWFYEKGTRVLTETGPRGGVVVAFWVYELPLILEVQFEGLPANIQPTEITRLLRDEHINVVKDAVDDRVQVRSAMLVMERYLASRGWPDARVTVQQENVSSMSVSLTFVIQLAMKN